MTLLVSKTDSMTLVVSISYKCPHALWVICIQCLNIILFYEYRYKDCVSVQVVEEEAGGEAAGATGCSRALSQAVDGRTTHQTHERPLLPRQ